MTKLNIVWLRRALRLEDNKVLFEALKYNLPVQIIFIFDSKILSRFSNKQDRRLSFIANSLVEIDKQLQKFGGSLKIFYGNSYEIITSLAREEMVADIFTEIDYESENYLRDQNISKQLGAKFHQILDHLLINPEVILKNDGESYKVFTPYMNAVRKYINDNPIEIYKYDIAGRLKDLNLSDFKYGRLLESLLTAPYILKEIGYEYIEDDLWHPLKANDQLDIFLNEYLANYDTKRNFLAENGTSKISPYLRFGILSIRNCFYQSQSFYSNGAYIWQNELLWREFYAYIMCHFPDSITQEFQIKYRGTLTWNNDAIKLNAFKEGKTGFPIIDAAMRQMKVEGWMHNRARMIVASFLTKNLFMDWRIGEEIFAQHLMDYELSSNVGGWQWTASVGTDAQPYFRVFNPISQGEKFDTQGLYIKKYVPELAGIPAKIIHDPEKLSKSGLKPLNYPDPIIDLKLTRQKAIEAFKYI